VRPKSVDTSVDAADTSVRATAVVVLALLTLACSAVAATGAQPGGELRFCLYSEPKTFNPLLVADTSSEAIRYMTAGVLIRVNRQTQELEPSLAVSWRVVSQGRGIAFKLRQHVAFSDGTPFSAEDVAYTMHTLFDPSLHAPTADSFHAGGAAVKIETPAADEVTLTFPTPVAGIERLFDQVGILSSKSPRKEMASLGPFYVAQYKPGSEVDLSRNPYYWKRDRQGLRLPRIDAVRLYIQQNRDMELIRFQRGDLNIMSAVSPELFDQLQARMPAAVRDLGPSLESEMMWFNQSPKAPLPAYKKLWFQSREFRRALSAAVNREDLCRLVYRGHAHPAEGPISPANRFWFNSGLKPHRYDPAEALALLGKAGFRLQDGQLYDAQSHAVEFSIVTNAGNQAREKIAQMIQQDLKAIGIRLNVVKLDYSAIIDRISQSLDYESCLLGLTNVDLDPDAQMNVWLSSASNHQWNPNQASPATPWEAEIDRLMQAQGSELNPARRKAYFDKVQEIVSQEVPFLYLVTKNALVAVSPSLQNADPSVLRPQAVWNIEMLALTQEVAKK
jgi:peptide/nickel transport system substrate-binding protein